MDSMNFRKWPLSEESSECISMNRKEMALDSAIEPLVIHSARMVIITANLLPK